MGIFKAIGAAHQASKAVRAGEFGVAADHLASAAGHMGGKAFGQVASRMKSTIGKADGQHGPLHETHPDFEKYGNGKSTEGWSRKDSFSAGHAGAQTHQHQGPVQNYSTTWAGNTPSGGHGQGGLSAEDLQAARNGALGLKGRVMAKAVDVADKWGTKMDAWAEKKGLTKAHIFGSNSDSHSGFNGDSW